MRGMGNRQLRVKWVLARSEDWTIWQFSNPAFFYPILSYPISDRLKRVGEWA